MNTLITIQSLLDRFHSCTFFSALASLGLRLYLAPVFWVAGMNKVESFPDIVQWFGNPDWGLGLPFPTLMASLATGAEVFGAVALLFGFAVRWATIPLMFTMIVAATTVHWHNGWQAVHDMMSPWANENAAGAIERLEKAKELLQTNGNYEWLTEHGNFIVSNNGIEWAATYFIMLLALFFLGGGRYLSADYWIRRQFMPNS
ncbi:MAG: DoxX family protein [Pseudomonadota bacterium]|nr:DoxX family protein [Pseudomonadota bacterium]